MATRSRVPKAEHRDIIVMGASAGGVQAIIQIVNALPAGFPAAVFVVVHVSPTSPGVMPTIVGRGAQLPVKQATDMADIEPGRIYFAAPGHHLLVKRDHMRVTHGPKENGFRPAVDPLFRTAARAYGARVIGVVLSGGLDDGTIGCSIIKSRGGVTIAQDPDDAVFPSMPLSAIQNAQVDYSPPAHQIGALLAELVTQPLPKGANTMPSKDAAEPDVAEGGTNALLNPKNNGKASGYTCPECGGALWEDSSKNILHFRCHVGHSYTGDALVSEQVVNLEDALWSALRALEENSSLRMRMAERAKRHNTETAREYMMQAEHANQRAEVLRSFLVNDRTSGAGNEKRVPRDLADTGPPGGKAKKPRARKAARARTRS